MSFRTARGKGGSLAGNGVAAKQRSGVRSSRADNYNKAALYDVRAAR